MTVMKEIALYNKLTEASIVMNGFKKVGIVEAARESPPSDGDDLPPSEVDKQLL